jgi:hypothetical protein
MSLLGNRESPPQFAHPEENYLRICKILCRKGGGVSAQVGLVDETTADRFYDSQGDAMTVCRLELVG